MTVSDMTELIIVRHGQTEWNRASRIQGYRDSALTDDGLAQARALAVRLAGESFAALLSSDLGRAASTAGIIAEHTGHRVRLEPSLRERNYGVLEGLTREEFRLHSPDAAQRYASRDPDFIIPGGESQREFVARVVAAFNALADEFHGQRIVVVSHGGVLAALHRHVADLPLDAPRTLPLPNAGYNIFIRSQGQWAMQRWGDTAHLDEQDVFSEV